MSALDRPNTESLVQLIYALHLGNGQLARSGKDRAGEVWDQLAKLLKL